MKVAAFVPVRMHSLSVCAHGGYWTELVVSVVGPGLLPFALALDMEPKAACTLESPWARHRLQPLLDMLWSNAEHT